MFVTIPEEIKSAIREVENALAHGEYSLVGSESRPSRLTGEQIKSAISDYCKLAKRERVTVSPEGVPDNDRREATVRQEAGQTIWLVDYDLWIDNRPSNLTLSLEIRKTDDGRWMATIDDLHVL